MDSHDHNHDLSRVKPINLVIVMLLNLIITAAEVIGGILAGSLSLVSDALHNLSDGLAVIISYFAMKIARKENDELRTYGYRRATILAAFINSAVLIAISLFLFREAYLKFVHPQKINGSLVIWVALVGFIANVLSVFLLKKGSRKSINLKSAYIHLLGDTFLSVAVILGGIAIFYFKTYWVDPFLTVLISLYVLKESFEILMQATNILMQGAPEHISLNEVVEDITKIDGINKIHHVHVWSLDDHNIHFEAHIDVNDMLVSEAESLCEKIEHELSEKYHITHTTLQCEVKGCEVDCCNKKQ